MNFLAIWRRFGIAWQCDSMPRQSMLADPYGSQLVTPSTPVFEYEERLEHSTVG